MIRFQASAVAPLLFAATFLNGPTSAGGFGSGRDVHHDVTDQALIGFIGPYRVGMHLTVQNQKTLLAGHYFYAPRPIDIPLKVGAIGEEITLREVGGGVFRLHLETNGKTVTHPLDFSTSTSLVGRWTKGTRTLPVRLDFDFSGAPQGSFRYRGITSEPPAAFEARVQRFLHGATADNRAEAASAVSYPLKVNGTKPLLVRDRADLFHQWRRIFTSCYVASLKTAVPHEMFVRGVSAMVANGAAWFDAKGATTLNLADCRLGGVAFD